ncbi:MAG TPA: futalosine hydrolase [Desulfurivibrio alkaliphilus]|uniref:Futalosine hydrolase n=1 Tax=Desulfurivibrio alkaliphilus TaxID=427923 RepID=A0A7C2XGY3_9BACT|nr:futalosine hydrolase [Desulfurivibrio alkaliphilus]
MNPAASLPPQPGGSPTPSQARLLVLAATSPELAPLERALGHPPRSTLFDFLLCGVGPVASAATVAAHLATRSSTYAGVVLSGVGGLYPREPSGCSGEPGLLEICLAEREILADFGIAAPHGAEPFSGSNFAAPHDFPLQSTLTSLAAAILTELAIPFYRGVFLTLNATTATRERGMALRDRHGGLCENMEGAAVALVCQRLGLPLLEMRCISNLVEDRDLRRWRLAEAIARQAEIMSRLLPRLAAAPLSRSRS